MDTMNFKIIGGGIAGLASALAVANAGGSAVVFEKAVNFEPVGAGLQLGPNAARALQKLGAWDAVKPITYAPPEIHMRDGRSGKILKHLALGKSFEQNFGLPYLTAHRADLHRALIRVADSCSSITIKTNVEMSDLSMQTACGPKPAKSYFPEPPPSRRATPIFATYCQCRQKPPM
jgi:2-polyprenyl-6-methoxyphenol hydroxylase-like FAD-dependent oxidoreductase